MLAFALARGEVDESLMEAGPKHEALIAREGVAVRAWAGFNPTKEWGKLLH